MSLREQAKERHERSGHKRKRSCSAAGTNEPGPYNKENPEFSPSEKPQRKEKAKEEEGEKAREAVNQDTREKEEKACVATSTTPKEVDRRGTPGAYLRRRQRRRDGRIFQDGTKGRRNNCSKPLREQGGRFRQKREDGGAGHREEECVAATAC